MRFTKEKLAEYPPQDETQQLIEFTTEHLARRNFKANVHTGYSWTEWLERGTQDEQDARLEPFREIAEHLYKSGLLQWPETTAEPEIGWYVEGPGQTRGPDAAPELDWIQTYGLNAEEALTYFRACVATNVPCRIRWSFRDPRS